MKNSKTLISIFTGSQSEANIIREILKDNDILFVSRDNFQSSIQAGFVDGVAGDVELKIENADKEKAEALIKEYEASIN